jgi:HSP20 family protein
MAYMANRDEFFDDLFDFRRDFDQLFHRMLSPSSRGTQSRQLSSGHPNQGAQTNMEIFTPAINAYVDRDNKRFICQVALPGIEPQDVQIQVQGNILSIHAERRISNESKDANYSHSEMVYGWFERDIHLPEGTDAEKVTAEARNGVIEISAPMSAAALPRKVEVKATETPRRIAAASGSR